MSFTMDSSNQYDEIAKRSLFEIERLERDVKVLISMVVALHCAVLSPATSLEDVHIDVEHPELNGTKMTGLRALSDPIRLSLLNTLQHNRIPCLFPYTAQDDRALSHRDSLSSSSFAPSTITNLRTASGVSSLANASRQLRARTRVRISQPAPFIVAPPSDLPLSPYSGPQTVANINSSHSVTNSSNNNNNNLQTSSSSSSSNSGSVNPVSKEIFIHGNQGLSLPALGISSNINTPHVISGNIHFGGGLLERQVGTPSHKIQNGVSSSQSVGNHLNTSPLPQHPGNHNNTAQFVHTNSQHLGKVSLPQTVCDEDTDAVSSVVDRQYNINQISNYNISNNNQNNNVIHNSLHPHQKMGRTSDVGSVIHQALPSPSTTSNNNNSNGLISMNITNQQTNGK